MNDYGSGQVLLNINNERISIWVDSTLRHIAISKVDKNGEIKGSYYSYDFYLRHTVDHLIIDASELISKLANIEKDCLLPF